MLEGRLIHVVDAAHKYLRSCAWYCLVASFFNKEIVVTKVFPPGSFLLSIGAIYTVQSYCNYCQ